MNNTFGQFSDDSMDAFNEAMVERYDFARCQRPDGSYYGTSGQCRKGTPAGAKETEPAKGKKSGGDSGEPTSVDPMEGWQQIEKANWDEPKYQELNRIMTQEAHAFRDAIEEVDSILQEHFNKTLDRNNEDSMETLEEEIDDLNYNLYEGGDW